MDESIKIGYDEKGNEIIVLEKRDKMTDTELLALRKIGLSYAAIGKIAGRTKQEIHRRLQKLGITGDNIEAFREHKADILENIQHRMIERISDKTLDAMLSKRGVTDLAILEDKIRLIRGESTSNVVTLSMVADSASKRREQRLKSLSASDSDNGDIVQDAEIID